MRGARRGRRRDLVPDSGTPAAQGYANGSGIPFADGLVKNRYVRRTFIQPDAGAARARHQAEVQPDARRDRRAARGGRRRLDRPRLHDRARSSACCSRPGAAEVHLRISSPPIVSPCYYGIDMAGSDELIAAHRSAGRDPRVARRRPRWPTSRSTACRPRDAAGRALLPRLPDARATRRRCPRSCDEGRPRSASRPLPVA